MALTESTTSRTCKRCGGSLPANASPRKHVCRSCLLAARRLRDANLRGLNMSLGRTASGRKRKPAPTEDCGECRRNPAQNTVAVPGTSAKVEVMRQRFERGEELSHPGDATGYRPLPMEMRQRAEGEWTYRNALREAASRLFVSESEEG